MATAFPLRPLAFLLGALACRPEDTEPEPEPEPYQALGDCDGTTVGPPGDSEERFAGPHGWWGSRDFGWGEALTTAAAWEEFQDDLLLDLAPVSFPDQHALAVWQIAPDCGLSVRGWSTQDLGDHWRLIVDLEDATACTEPCGAPGGALVAVAVQALPGPAELCRRTYDGCTSP